jgi:hypothetical protein
MFRSGCICPLCGHMSVTARTHARVAQSSRSTLVLAGQGSCSTGDCSTVEVAHDSRIQPGPGGRPARSRPGPRGPDAGTADRVPQRDRADDGRRSSRPARRRRSHHRRPDHRRRPRPPGARGHGRDRRHRRHPHARHDRHPPAHVADGDARIWRRLDAHPVLRLELPAVGQVVPAAGHLRRQPAQRDRGDRRRGDDLRGLVAQPAHGRPRRGGGGRAAGGAGAVCARLRQHPGRPVGVVGHAGVPRLRVPAVQRRQ